MCRWMSALKCIGYCAKRGCFIRFNLRTLCFSELAEGSAETVGNCVNRQNRNSNVCELLLSCANCFGNGWLSMRMGNATVSPRFKGLPQFSFRDLCSLAPSSPCAEGREIGQVSIGGRRRRHQLFNSFLQCIQFGG